MAQTSKNDNTIGKNILSQMKKNGFTRSTLAAASNIPYPTLCDWIKGRTAPRLERLEDLAECLNCSTGDLVSSENYICATAHPDFPKTICAVNVLGSLNQSNVIDTIVTTSEDLDDSEDDSIFGLKIQGDSMTPRFFDGDTILVKKIENWKLDLRTGDIVVAIVNGDILCKKLQIDDDGVSLIPTNEKYRATHYPSEDLNEGNVIIYGKVLEVRGKIS